MNRTTATIAAPALITLLSLAAAPAATANSNSNANPALTNVTVVDKVTGQPTTSADLSTVTIKGTQNKACPKWTTWVGYTLLDSTTGAAHALTVDNKGIGTPIHGYTDAKSLTAAKNQGTHATFDVPGDKLKQVLDARPTGSNGWHLLALQCSANNPLARAKPGQFQLVGTTSVHIQGGKITLPIPTSTTLSFTPTQLFANQTTTIAATIKTVASGQPVISGTVQFFIAGTAVGGPVTVDSNGVATLPGVQGPFPVGIHTIKAVYTPAAGTAFLTSNGEVNMPVRPVTTISLTGSPLSGAPGQLVTLVGTLPQVDGDYPVGTCEFFDNGVAIAGTAGTPVQADGTCTYANNNLSTAGAHTFSVKFTPTDPTLFTPAVSNQVPAEYTPSGTVTQPDEQTIVVNVPVGNLTIFTPYTPSNPLNLGTMTLTNSGYQASAKFAEIRVTDTRAGQLGWTASLDRADFVTADPNIKIDAKHSGLHDVRVVSVDAAGHLPSEIAVQDVSAGSTDNGPARFAKLDPNKFIGTSVLDGTFVLKDVPTSTKAGQYTATVIFTVA